MESRPLGQLQRGLGHKSFACFNFSVYSRNDFSLLKNYLRLLFKMFTVIKSQILAFILHKSSF